MLSQKNKKKDEDNLQDGECNVDEIRALAKKFEDKYVSCVVVYCDSLALKIIRNDCT